ncbi:MAG: nitroreductase family protein, partial [Candidatus Omnitrophica bacterium]|nr:nitroreductase family protein [Candidatus Omnitrophota bacterium]
EDLLKCVEAARLAPSACNSQPWSFIVVDAPDRVRDIGQKIFSGLYNMNRFAIEASALIVVISEKQKFLSVLGGKIRDTRYYLIDIGIACEHLVLQAEELGIGSCWLGWFDEKALKAALSVPRDKKIDIVIALGYAEGDASSRPRIRKTLDEITSFDASRRTSCPK